MSLMISGVSKSYRSSGLAGDCSQVLRDLDLNLEAGGVAALLGENGIGKTTLLKCILGLVLPDRGRIAWAGEPVSRLAGRGLVGYCPEDLRFPAMVSLEEYARDLAALRGIRDLRATLYPELVQGLLAPGEDKRPLPRLSKGNKKKAAFIQAVFHQPSLLVLDEPTDGLDPVSRERMLQTIRDLGRRGSLVLMSSHQMGDVRQAADRTLILAGGRIAAVGRTEEIQGSPEDWYLETMRALEGSGDSC